VALGTYESFRRQYDRLILRLFEKARQSLNPPEAAWAEEAQVHGEDFARALYRSAEHYFSRQGAVRIPSRSAVESYLESLHLQDLLLTCACAAGSEPAWEYLVKHYRPVMRVAARAIAGSSAGEELADNLLAELYGIGRGAGLNDADATGSPRPLLDYFHGRSKLSTWLRAVLAQRHVDVLRASRPTESMDAGKRESAHAGGRAVLQDSSELESQLDPDRPRYVALLQSVLCAALAALEPRDRLRLAYYYVHDLTLAQIGLLMGEHEATVSRKLERTRRALRKKVDAALRDGQPTGQGLSEAQIRFCYECALEQWPFDLTRVLAGSSATLETSGEKP